MNDARPAATTNASFSAEPLPTAGRPRMSAANEMTVAGLTIVRATNWR
jgi:hypothetical protein